jgi:16S rRNA (uracil1498-N3)-methyltransferase
MHARFFAPDLEPGASRVRLPLDEARHLLRVMRLGPGDAVRVFNGRGVECAGEVAAVDRDEVVVTVGEAVAAAAESPTAITLAQAVLKGDAMDGVVRDAVMLGVAALVPLLSARVEGDRRSHAAGLRLARWQRIAVASAKQCGRAVVPVVSAPMSLAACLSSVPAEARIALVEPTASLPAAGLGQMTGQAPPESLVLFVGPEGGWADEELRLLEGYQASALTLGSRTLRAESCALVGLSALHTVWGEFG